MNADILKPFLSEAASRFPGQKIEIQLSIIQMPDGAIEQDDYQALVKINGEDYGWGANIPTALDSVTKKFDPTRRERQKAGKLLREKAQRIEDGTEPIPATTEPATQPIPAAV